MSTGENPIDFPSGKFAGGNPSPDESSNYFIALPSAVKFSLYSIERLLRLNYERVLDREKNIPKKTMKTRVKSNSIKPFYQA